MKSKDNGFSDIPVINDQVASWPVLLASFLYYGRYDLFKLIRTIKSIKYDKFEIMYEEQAAEAAG
jgi:hypothetical protein